MYSLETSWILLRATQTVLQSKYYAFGHLEVNNTTEMYPGYHSKCLDDIRTERAYCWLQPESAVFWSAVSYFRNCWELHCINSVYLLKEMNTFLCQSPRTHTLPLLGHCIFNAIQYVLEYHDGAERVPIDRSIHYRKDIVYNRTVCLFVICLLSHFSVS